MGMPTQRRHSSIRATMPMKPITMYRGSFIMRLDSWMTVMALAA
jgi:hypothetical protein